MCLNILCVHRDSQLLRSLKEWFQESQNVYFATGFDPFLRLNCPNEIDLIFTDGKSFNEIFTLHSPKNNKAHVQ